MVDKEQGSLSNRIIQIIILILGVVGVTSCTNLSSFIPSYEGEMVENPRVVRNIKDLAGLWEYQDDAGQGTIVLDDEGGGAYDWQEGRFETQTLQDGVWKGTWHQSGNDREGGFELRILGDSPIAEGHWWYTRIGDDHNPHQSGGSLTMKRSSSLLIGEK